MRAHRFVLLKPIVLLAVLPLERSLCRQACDSMPGAHSIQGDALMRGRCCLPQQLRPASRPLLCLGLRLQPHRLLARSTSVAMA